MTIKEAVYMALSDVNISSDDHRFPLRYVYRKIKAARAELMRQYFKNGEISISGIAQVLSCVKMKMVDVDECGELGFDGLLKSCDVIPDPIETEQRPMITGVYTASGRNLDFTTMRQVSDQTRRRFKKADPDPLAFIRGKYLYIAFYEDIDCLDVTVEGHFFDQEQVYIFNNPDACLPVYDMPFEMPEYLTRRVTRIVADELRIKLGIPVDVTNNSKEDVTNQTNAT